MTSSRGYDGTHSDLSSHGSARRPPVITEAEESFQAQQRARIRKYSIMMGFRIPALIAAVIVYSTWNNVWVSLVIVAISVPLPWMAVLIANDAPPRRKDRLRRYQRDQHDRQLDAHSHRTIEG